MTRWSAITPTRRSCSALAYGSRSKATADKTSTGSYTTSRDATRTGGGERTTDVEADGTRDWRSGLHRITALDRGLRATLDALEEELELARTSDEVGPR